MGHLELNGFKVYPAYTMQDGMDSKLFDESLIKYFLAIIIRDQTTEKFFYLGNPYEMFWNDVNDPRGFTVFDTETLEHTSINNPHKLFHNIYYEDTNYKNFNSEDFHNKIVKVIVRKKSNLKNFEKFIDKLSSGVYELKIMENFQLMNLKILKLVKTRIQYLFLIDILMILILNLIKM